MATRIVRMKCGLMSENNIELEKLKSNYSNHNWERSKYSTYYERYNCLNCSICYDVRDRNFIMYGFSTIEDFPIKEILTCESVQKFHEKYRLLLSNQMNIVSKRFYKKYSTQKLMTKLCVKNNWPPFWISKSEVRHKKYLVRKINGIPDISFVFAGTFLYNIAQLDSFSLTLAKKRNDPELDKLIRKWTMIDILS